MADRITIEQLLNLADRAEYGGGLTQAEADRLRAGITLLSAKCRELAVSRRSVGGRRAFLIRQGQEAARRLDAVRALVTSTRQHGGRTVLIPTLAAVLDAPIEFGTRQGGAA